MRPINTSLLSDLLSYETLFNKQICDFTTCVGGAIYELYVHVGYDWYLHNWPMLILAICTLIPQVQTTVVKATWQENFPFETPLEPTV